MQKHEETDPDGDADYGESPKPDPGWGARYESGKMLRRANDHQHRQDEGASAGGMT